MQDRCTYNNIKIKVPTQHCAKSVRIRSFSGPYSVPMRDNTDQKNSEYGHFSCSAEVAPFYGLVQAPAIGRSEDQSS